MCIIVDDHIGESFLLLFFNQYSAKEFQQALDILDAEEPVNKKLVDKSEKDDSGTESAKEWDMSPASVS